MADIQHANIPEAQLHETKGASTASANTWLGANGDGTATFQSLPFEFKIEDSYDAQSFDDQTLAALGTELQVTLGDAATSPGGSVSVAADGTITINQDGVYFVSADGSCSRDTSTGFTELAFSLRIGGTQVGRSSVVGLESADIAVTAPVTSSEILSLEAGTQLTYHMRRIAGTTSGNAGLTQTTITDANWGDAPSARVGISKLSI